MNTHFPLLVGLSAFALLSHAGFAGTLYYDTNGNAPGSVDSTTGNFNTPGFFTTNPLGDSATVNYVQGSDVVFSASDTTPVTGNTASGINQITVSDTELVTSLTFNNGTDSIVGSGSPVFTIANGVTVANNINGTTTLDSTLGNIQLSGNQTWADNSSQALNVGAGVVSSATSGNTILKNNGTGTGAVTISGVVGDGSSGSTLGIEQDTATSTLVLNGANTYSGGTTVNAGAIDFNNTQSFGTGPITLNGGEIDATQSLNGNFSTTINEGVNGGTLNFGNHDVLFASTITGGNSITFGSGDVLVVNQPTQDAGVVNFVGNGTIGTQNRILFFLDPSLLDTAKQVNVSNGYIIDIDEFDTVTGPVNFGTNTALEARLGSGINFSNVTLASSGTFLIGADDVPGVHNSFVLSNSTTGVLANLTGNLVISTNSADNDTEFDNSFSGTGSLEYKIAQGGTVTMIVNPGSFSGGTTIDSGTLQIGNNGGVMGANGSNITIEDGAFFRFTTGLGGFIHNFIEGGPNGTATIIGRGDDFISGNITGGTGITIDTNNGAGDVIISGAGVNDAGAILLTGGGRLLLGSNIDILDNNSTLHVTDKTVFSVGSGSDFGEGSTPTVTINNQITLDEGTALEERATTATFTNVVLPTAGTLTLGADDVGGGQIIIANSSALALTGDLTLNITSGNVLTPAPNGQENGAGVAIISGITGDFALTMNGVGVAGTNGQGSQSILALLGTNSYTGATTINGGTLEIEGDNSQASSLYAVKNGTLQIGGFGGVISSTADIVLGDGTTSGVLALGDTNFSPTTGVAVTVESLTTSGTGTGNSVVNDSGAAGDSSLMIVNNADDSFSGTIGGTGSGQNNIFLEKSGTGILTLSGNNTYNGGTQVDSGKLAVNGSVVGNVAVNFGAEVGGHGKIGGTISGAGAVGPGNSPGILTAGAVDTRSGTSFNFEFTLNGGPNYGNAAASGNDILHLDGANPFLAALTGSNAINLYFNGGGTNFIGGFFVDGATDNLTANIANATFNYYVLDNTNGTVSYNGNLYDLSTGTASTLAVTGAGFADGTVDGVTEQFTVVGPPAVPEPSTYVMMALGALTLLGLRRFHKLA